MVLKQPQVSMSFWVLQELFYLMDADTKGGIALGITKQIGIPLRFVGVGEKIADLEIFIPERIVNRIMGEGDLATLAEKTAAIIDEKEAKKLNQKIKKASLISMIF